MSLSEREQNMYGKDVEIVSRDDDCTVYRLSDDTGEVVMTSYTVFPGIELIYNDVHIQSCTIKKSSSGKDTACNVFEINHCKEGRIECGFRNEYVYLAPGDLTIAKKSDAAHSSYFPLSHYHGISISIDIDRSPDCFSCILGDVDVRPSSIAEKFCSDEKCFITRSNKSVEHIFSELYTVPEKIRKGYFKVKILELLLFLSGMEILDEDIENRVCSRSQVDLAKSVCDYLTKHMDDRITIAQLSKSFNASDTLIKTSFKSVYGVSVYSYIRKQKMQEAALMLQHTNSTVTDIAGRFGYDNASKFAAAFRDVIGMSPAEYRNNQTISV